MFTAANIFDAILLWFFEALSMVMVMLALRGARVEREQGLPRSPRRLVSAFATFAVITALVLYDTHLIFKPAPSVTEAPAAPAPTAPAEPPQSEKAQKLAGEIGKLKSDRHVLDEQIAAKQAEYDKEVPPAPAADTKLPPEPAKPAKPFFELRSVIRYVVMVVAAVGLFLLVYLGDPTVLLKRDWFGIKRRRTERSRKAQSDLDALAAAADGGRYREGLALAAANNEVLLDRFDRLDWAFLKAYCQVQIASSTSEPQAGKDELLRSAIAALAAILEEAPNRGEAAYLLAMAHGLLGNAQEALNTFASAKILLPPKINLPFAHNESVCLLDLGEDLLGKGDTQGATRMFDRVSQLGTLVDKIPSALIKIRLLAVRRHLQANELKEAEAGLAILRRAEGIDPANAATVQVICDAMQAILAVRSGDIMRVSREVEAFLKQHLPEKLPEPDEGIADEYLDTPLAGIELRLPPQTYRTMLFIQAQVAAQVAARQGTALSAAAVSAIAQPLFRALQFELRQRDALAALGGLYFWFLPEKRPKAMQWLEAAINMGVDSRFARRILDRARYVERENRSALEWFRSAAAQFLHDPTISGQVRAALVEELGRFRGFEPLLLEMERAAGTETREPTLTLLRERALYVDRMAVDVAQRRPDVKSAEFDRLREDYSRLISGLSASTGQMGEIERRLIQEIGKTVLS